MVSAFSFLESRAIAKYAYLGVLSNRDLHPKVKFVLLIFERNDVGVTYILTVLRNFDEMNL